MSMLSSVSYPMIPKYQQLNPFMKAGCCGATPSMQAAQTVPKGFQAELTPNSQPVTMATQQAMPTFGASATQYATAPMASTKTMATPTIAPAMQPLAGNFWAQANDAIRPLGLGRKLYIMG